MTPNRRLEPIQKWSDYMKTSSTRISRTIAGKIILGLVFAAMIVNMDVVPALGKDGHDRMRNHDNGRYEQRGRGHERGRYVYVHGRRVYQPYGYGYGYRERVYAPPPVIYAPPPPPGIRIFFPPLFIPPVIIHP